MAKRSDTSAPVERLGVSWEQCPALTVIAARKLFPLEKLHWTPGGHWMVTCEDGREPRVIASGRTDGDVFDVFEAFYADRLLMLYGVEYFPFSSGAT